MDMLRSRISIHVIKKFIKGINFYNFVEKKKLGVVTRITGYFHLPVL